MVELSPDVLLGTFVAIMLAFFWILWHRTEEALKAAKSKDDAFNALNRDVAELKGIIVGRMEGKKAMEELRQKEGAH